MNGIAGSVALSMVFLSLGMSATAQDEPRAAAEGRTARASAAKKCEALLHDGLEALAAQRLADAERWLKQALAEAEKIGPDSLEMATVFEGLGGLAGARKEQAQAESFLVRAAAIREKALGPDDAAVAQTLQNLATLKVATEKNAEAEPIARRAVAIREKDPGPDGQELADALDLLALIEVFQDNIPQAEHTFRRALAIREKALGPDHPEVAKAMIKMAQVRASRVVSAQMGAMLKSVENPGAEVPKTPLADDYSAAEALLERALAIREKSLGPQHPDTIETIETLANLYNWHDDHAHADPLLRRLLAIREKALGPDNPDVADTLGSLAIRAKEQGKYRDAESLLRRAVAIQEKAARAKPDDKEAQKAAEWCARELHKAVHSAQVMEDPGLRPTEGDLKFFNGLKSSTKEPNLASLFNGMRVQVLDDSVADADLVHLRGLVNAEHLTIWCSGKITDAGLVHFQQLTRLKELTLTGSGIRGPGLVHLKGLTELEWLSLGAARSLDDNGLANLPTLPRLKKLDLAYTQISDTGLAHLERLPALQTLTVDKSKITKAGIEKLQRERPGLKVEDIESALDRPGSLGVPPPIKDDTEVFPQAGQPRP
jgi:tetratricopeptide (TPR) repeat protein